MTVPRVVKEIQSNDSLCLPDVYGLSSHNCGKIIVSRRNIPTEVEVALPHELHKLLTSLTLLTQRNICLFMLVPDWSTHLLMGFLKLERGGWN